MSVAGTHHKAPAGGRGTNGWRPVRGLCPCDPIF